MCRLIVLLAISCVVFPVRSAWAGPGDAPGSRPAASSPAVQAFTALCEPRDRRYAEQLETCLRRWLVDDYAARSAEAWQRDETSVEAFVASVEPNRRRWLARLNPPALPVTGPLERRPYGPLADLGAEWLTLPLGPLEAEAILAVPATGQKKYPLVIAPHGLGGSPEGMFGLEQERNYHAYARRLVERGWAVLAPLNICGVDRRNRLERLCRLADTTLSGIELVRLQHLLDAVLADERIDAARVAAWGLSLGGRELLFWMPLEPRIGVGIVSGWFNRRPEKMAVPSERYSCFLETDEEHAFLQGWLTEFADVDIVSLIVPRPLLIQTGKKDPIAYWPDVEADFKLARQPYERLGMGERMQFDLHEGGHELRLESGLAFLERWLEGAGKDRDPEP